MKHLSGEVLHRIRKLFNMQLRCLLFLLYFYYFIESLYHYIFAPDFKN